MNEEHATRAELEAYVSGLAEPEAEARLLTHVSGCAACSEALANEASIEVALHDAANAKPAALSPSLAVPDSEKVRARLPEQRVVEIRSAKSSRPMIMTVAAFAVAVAAAAMLAYRSEKLPVVPPSITQSQLASAGEAIRIECAARDDAAEKECRRHARCAGELVEDGPSAHEIPQYETLFAECKHAPGLGAQRVAIGKP